MFDLLPVPLQNSYNILILKHSLTEVKTFKKIFFTIYLQKESMLKCSHNLSCK